MAVPPGSHGESTYRFQPELLALAKYPNIAVKAIGQIGYAEDAYPFRSFHAYLHRCFDDARLRVYGALPDFDRGA
jgi:L-fuconolactonase